MSGKDCLKASALGVPLFLLFSYSFFMTGWVTYSLHLFIPVAPQHIIECSFFHSERKFHLSDYLASRSTFNATPPDHDCSAIRRRRYLPMDIPSFVHFPYNLFFVRHVSKDYDFVEKSLTMMFSPHHFYCITIDKNATEEFKERVRLLGRCLFNVIVPEEDFNGSEGRGYFESHRACFDKMSRYTWRHAIISQEEEIPAQSVRWMSMKASRLGNASLLGSSYLGVNKLDQPIFNGSAISSAVSFWWTNRTDPLIISRPFQPKLYSFLLANGTIERIIKSAPPANHSLHCKTGRKDDFGNCILGMEDFNVAAKGRRAFVRADSQFDFGFVQCMHETVFKRTYKDIL